MAKNVKWESAIFTWDSADDNKKSDGTEYLFSDVIKDSAAKGWEPYAVVLDRVMNDRKGRHIQHIAFFKRQSSEVVARKESVDKLEKDLERREQELRVREEVVAKREAGLVEVGPVRVKTE